MQHNNARMDSTPKINSLNANKNNSNKSRRWRRRRRIWNHSIMKIWCDLDDVPNQILKSYWWQKQQMGKLEFSQNKNGIFTWWCRPSHDACSCLCYLNKQWNPANEGVPSIHSMPKIFNNYNEVLAVMEMLPGEWWWWWWCYWDDSVVSSGSRHPWWLHCLWLLLKCSWWWRWWWLRLWWRL